MVQRFHTGTKQQAEKFRARLGRVYYVTPTSYLELIGTFKALLAAKRKEIMDLKDRYSNGYDCLVTTETQVNKLQEELIEMQPIIAEKKKDAEEQLKVVSVEVAKADEIRTKVAAEQADAKVIADKAEAIRVNCKTELDKTVPIQKEAENAVKCINKGDIAILKKLNNPPKAIKPVGQVLCMMFRMKPTQKIDDPENPGKKVLNWWGETIKLLSDPNMTEKLIKYDKDSIDQQLVDDIRPFLAEESFKPAVLKSTSEVAMNLSKWVYAMDQCYTVSLVVGPLRADLAKAEGEYEEVRKVLAVKEAALNKVEQEVAQLQANLDRTVSEVKELEEKSADCEARLVKAKSLISGLGGEK
jgi:dynein heavy chain